MSEIDYSTISARDLAGLIGSHLSNEGIDVTLVGGTCVSIYSDNLYQSDDLDFVDRSYTPSKHLKAAMAKLGFYPIGRYYEHPCCPFLVEFPPGPLSVGDQPIRQWATLTTPLGTFSLITAEDCIKDRLAAFFHWRDRQAFQQALWVAKDQRGEYDLNAIRAWSEHEGELAKFDEFISLLERD
ncbi:hypothetical protein [Motiliproteus sediminis]|uniref:hypothetical protein n=1 Tax=Motiliproteus sediminis TaxID=1468178 RepID=UPI001AEF7003|nr:hypothetical protein [Motiliproteus sediminis]